MIDRIFSIRKLVSNKNRWIRYVVTKSRAAITRPTFEEFGFCGRKCGCYDQNYAKYTKQFTETHRNLLIFPITISYKNGDIHSWSVKLDYTCLFHINIYHMSQKYKYLKFEASWAKTGFRNMKSTINFIHNNYYYEILIRSMKFAIFHRSSTLKHKQKFYTIQNKIRM